MNRRNFITLTSLCMVGAGTPVVTSAQAPQEPVYIYAYQEGEDPNNHVKHTLFIIGDGAKGAARYTAASFVNGKRSSLASSGSGTYTTAGDSITVKAGKLDGNGPFKKGESIEIGEQKFVFAMKM
ncbi:hypothetical protein WG899_05105 [Paucibacter sp. AS339]|uniref:hypothetical protein n=1 Tax=Paucibacter hankyongi TaxID=3133434 RepID=UPI00309D6FDA